MFRRFLVASAGALLFFPTHPMAFEVPRALIAECAAGYIGGVAKQACTHPFETVATLSEVRRGSNPAPLPLFQIARRPGRLYSGFFLTAAMNAPYAALFHVTMWATACVLRERTHLPPAAVDLLSGALGACAGCIVGVPLETLKHRMQVQAPGYEGLRRAVSTGLADPKGLYAGTSTTLLRNVPYNGVQWGSFALLARVVPLWLAGPIAGVTTAMVTNPLDVVNTRLQTQTVLYRGVKESTAEVDALYRGPIHAARTMVRLEGPWAFWRGVTPRAAGYAPSALVFFAVYGAVKKALMAV